MNRFINENKVFLLLQCIFLFLGAVIILLFERGSEILYVNGLHNHFLNQFFLWVTRLAEAPLVMLILIITLTMSYGKGMVLLLTYLLNGAVTQFMKIVVFAGEARPAAYFEGKAQLNFAEGLTLLKDNTFPSGHTSGAFAVLFMISILTTDKRWAAPLFTMALLVGVSRVYLMMHFFRDIYWGSITGVMVASMFYLLFVRSNWYHNLSWKDKSLVN
ncbi:MAG: phosphatase PAP2 family protein [Chitinophagales bacterium]